MIEAKAGGERPQGLEGETNSHLLETLFRPQALEEISQLGYFLAGAQKNTPPFQTLQEASKIHPVGTVIGIMRNEPFPSSKLTLFFPPGRETTTSTIVLVPPQLLFGIYGRKQSFRYDDDNNRKTTVTEGGIELTPVGKLIDYLMKKSPEAFFLLSAGCAGRILRFYPPPLEIKALGGIITHWGQTEKRGFWPDVDILCVGTDINALMEAAKTGAEGEEWLFSMAYPPTWRTTEKGAFGRRGSLIAKREPRRKTPSPFLILRANFPGTEGKIRLGEIFQESPKAMALLPETEAAKVLLFRGPDGRIWGMIIDPWGAVRHLSRGIPRLVNDRSPTVIIKSESFPSPTPFLETIPLEPWQDFVEENPKEAAATLARILRSVVSHGNVLGASKKNNVPFPPQEAIRLADSIGREEAPETIGWMRQIINSLAEGLKEELENEPYGSGSIFALLSFLESIKTLLNCSPKLTAKVFGFPSFGKNNELLPPSKVSLEIIKTFFPKLHWWLEFWKIDVFAIAEKARRLEQKFGWEEFLKIIGAPFGYSSSADYYEGKPFSQKPAPAKRMAELAGRPYSNRGGDWNVDATKIAKIITMSLLLSPKRFKRWIRATIRISFPEEGKSCWEDRNAPLLKELVEKKIASAMIIFPIIARFLEKNDFINPCRLGQHLEEIGFAQAFDFPHAGNRTNSKTYLDILVELGLMKKEERRAKGGKVIRKYQLGEEGEELAKSLIPASL